MKKTLLDFLCQLRPLLRIKPNRLMIATLLIICSLNLQARDTLEEQGTIVLSVESASVKEILETLEAQTNYHFFYNHKAMHNSERISLSLNYVSFETALKELANQADLVFKVKGDQIVVKKKQTVPVISIFNGHQPSITKEELDRVLASSKKATAAIISEFSVSGQVLDEGKAPMPGVNIIVKGTATGTTTDVDGRYTITVPDGDAVLVFSFIGYQSREVLVGTQSTINLTMEVDVSTLNEIVVVGYGTQKRTSVTGAVSSVDAKEISELAVPSVQSALQGRVAGVNVTNSGSPGTNPIVRIRGIGSVTGSSDPLYVVDGLPTGGLNNFDPNDIESVEVLKDAASSAIYGSRAANGVILITTKKGAKGQGMRVDVDSYYGIQQPWKELDLLNRNQYLQYGTTLVTNANQSIPYRFTHMDESIYDGTSQTYAQTETDWQDEMFRTAPIYQTQAAISSSTEKLNVYSSFGLFGQDGIILGTDFKRYNYRLNSELKLSKRVSFGQTLTIASTDMTNQQESGGRTIIQHTIRGIPYLPVKDPTTQGGYRGASADDGSDPENPVRVVEMDPSVTKQVKVFGTAFLKVNIMPSLNYQFTFGGDFSTSRNTVDQPIYNDGFSGRTTHNLQDNRTTTFSPLYQNQLTFDKTIGKHYVNVTAVAERQDVNFTQLNASSQQSSNFIYSMVGGQNQTIGANDTWQTSLISYLGRVNYEYNNKYLISASIRRDGFSGFAPGNKWGDFPGVSVGWRISEESFMQNVDAISELKLRASYGSLGVNNVGPFDWQSTISVNSLYPFTTSSSQSGSFFDQLPNQELAWEKTDMTNFGFDLGLLNNRLSITAEYFVRKVDDMLLRVPTAPSMGYSVDMLANVGKMENSGFEFQVGYNKSQGDFTFNLSANLSTVKNEVTDMFIPGATIYRGENADFGGFNITKTETGQSVQGFYGWMVDGIFQSEAEIIGADNAPNAPRQNLPMSESDPTVVDMDMYNDPANKGLYTRPGDIRFKDINNDGVIDDNDRTYLGSFLPDFSYGVNFSANYKNFDFTLFIQGVHGNEVYNGTKVLTEGMLRLFGAGTEVLNAWSPDNTNTNVPRAVGGDPNQNSRTSDRFIEDGSYMRIKNLSIGYSLPSTVLGSFANGALNKLRFYASFQNLLTITNYSGYDPEIGARTSNNLVQGIDYGQFPQARTIMGGIQIGF